MSCYKPLVYFIYSCTELRFKIYAINKPTDTGSIIISYIIEPWVKTLNIMSTVKGNKVLRS